MKKQTFKITIGYKNHKENSYVCTDFLVSNYQKCDALLRAVTMLDIMREFDMFPPAHSGNDEDTIFEVQKADMKLSEAPPTIKTFMFNPVEELLESLHEDYGLYWYTNNSLDAVTGQLRLPL